jgi:hypothetical protein
MRRVRRARPAGLIAVVSLVCVSVWAAPAADAGGSSGAIKVTVIKKNGKRKTSAKNYQICATPKPHEGATGTLDCKTVVKGRATVRNLAPGGWYLQTVGGTGIGPCYNKRNDGKVHQDCTKVKVKAGKTTKIRWRVPKTAQTP